MITTPPASSNGSFLWFDFNLKVYTFMYKEQRRLPESLATSKNLEKKMGHFCRA